jgi:hypothetical protein
MKRPVALFPIVLALGTIILAPLADARADGREEGPTEIAKCQTIDKPGSYKLVNNLSFPGSSGTCLSIIANSVSIDLAGFTIRGPGGGNPGPTAILAMPSSDQVLEGIAVRNGSISGFGTGVSLGGGSSLVEGLRVFSGGIPVQFGIIATGIVKGNTVVRIVGLPGQGVGISATGIITGNYVTGSRVANYKIGQGSTVIGNTAVNSSDPGFGFLVSCPSNVTDNTAVNSNRANLLLDGTGCNNTNNVAP